MLNNSSHTHPVNWDEGLTRVAGNKALFEKLLLRIAGDLPNDLNTIEEAIAQEDMNKLSAVAHSLKGSSGNLSITAVYQHSIDLEAAAKNTDITGAAAILEELKESAAHFIGYVATL